MIGLRIAATGAALASVALVVLFGPWAAVVCGVGLVVVGLLVDWEALSGKHPAAPPWRDD